MKRILLFQVSPQQFADESSMAGGCRTFRGDREAEERWRGGVRGKSDDLAGVERWGGSPAPACPQGNSRPATEAQIQTVNCC